MNLVEYLARATDYLDRNDVTSPRLNSELLLCHLLGIERIDIYTGFERTLTDRESDDYRKLLARRASGIPLQYITGEAPFRGVSFEVVPGVFIPRPETELVVEAALEVLPRPARVLDVGSGCGNIAVSIALERSGVHVTAVDVSRKAVELTSRNAARHGVADRVESIESDVFSAVAGHRYDLIVSNPPYVPETARGSLPPEVRDYEPASALFAGPDGAGVLAPIVSRAPGHLEPGGRLVLEIDETHGETVAGMLREAGFEGIEVMDDLAGRTRIARARCPAGGPAGPGEADAERPGLN